ncbi:hypothetical protein RHA1_ro06696 [Rhodococcus jostii RHA1]|uniref:Uncharacterized protein n=1 Tax=Rhodococcus jostii (strain RHA1) TaxID=101510 RepID=Q0S1W7_RHOJR|nr:hypothetical protein RHA1_ro06696 [Rhodococcus jostii RHA1]
MSTSPRLADQFDQGSFTVRWPREPGVSLLRSRVLVRGCPPRSSPHLRGRPTERRLRRWKKVHRHLPLDAMRRTSQFWGGGPQPRVIRAEEFRDDRAMRPLATALPVLRVPDLGDASITPSAGQPVLVHLALPPWTWTQWAITSFCTCEDNHLALAASIGVNSASTWAIAY